MAWTHGTVTGHRDLLDILQTFLSTDATLVAANQNWVVNKAEEISSYSMAITNGNQAYGSTFKDLYLMGPGLAQQDQIFCQIRTYEIPASSVIGWMIAGADGFDTDEKWEDQENISSIPSTTPSIKFFPLVSSLIEYWIIANGRRWILICKIAGDFFTIYNGLFLPYALPSEYPYPIFASGTSSTINELVSSTGLSSFFNPDKDNASFLRNIDGLWFEVKNSIRCSHDSQDFAIWPWVCSTSTGNAFITCGNPDGSFSLLPAIVYAGMPSIPQVKDIFGELEGVYQLPGLAASGQTSPAAEDTITIGSDTYLVVQNCDRTDRYNFAALKLE